jgi:hypothetical protein
MKRILLIFVILMVSNATISLFSQVPPPPPQEHGSTSNQSGGGAPIGGGLFILLGLGAAYGGKKLYNMGKDKLEE